jgi:hypothetical protein
VLNAEGPKKSVETKSDSEKFLQLAPDVSTKTNLMILILADS